MEIQEEISVSKEKRNKKAKRNIIILILIGVFGFVFMFLYEKITKDRLIYFGEETTGVVTDITQRYFPNPKGGITNGTMFHTIKYEYYIEGKTHNGILINPYFKNLHSVRLFPLNIGDSVTITYLKNNPKISKLHYFKIGI